MSKSKKTNQVKGLLFILLGLTVLVAVLALLLNGKDLILLNPKGLIAEQESRLMIDSTLIMAAFGGVILSILYFFAWRYRDGNHKSEYKSSAGQSKTVAVAAWFAPITIFVILASMMLPATQKLEPQRAIEADKEQITIRAIAMQWKWVFLYPEHDIATVNFVQIPVDTPIRFELTADEAPMNSFWIPHLGGMLYSMTEHVNPLNLMANEIGDYPGGAAEINGRGFAKMRFNTKVTSGSDFEQWVDLTTKEAVELDSAMYDELLRPSENNSPATYYSPTNNDIFVTLLQKYANGSHSHYAMPEHEGYEEH